MIRIDMTFEDLKVAIAPQEGVGCDNWAVGFADTFKGETGNAKLTTTELCALVVLIIGLGETNEILTAEESAFAAHAYKILEGKLPSNLDTIP